MINTKICPVCLGYCLDYAYLANWKKCQSCGFTFKVDNPKNMKKIEPIEYLGDTPISSLSEEYKQNLELLLKKVNDLLALFGEYRPVTSGFRSMEKHLSIYKAKNEKRKAQGLPELRVPMSSRHLSCQAIDLADSNDRLKNWIKANEGILVKLDIYCEDFTHTDTWVHIQIVSPKSGKRFFIP